jgi:hypothetical protein
MLNATLTESVAARPIHPPLGLFDMQRAVVWLFLTLTTFGWTTAARGDTIHVAPAHVTLLGRFDRAQLIVRRGDESGRVTERSEDLTSTASFQSSNTNVARVEPGGQIFAVGDGETIVSVSVGELKHDIPATVSGVTDHPMVDFTNQIRPILNKMGCASAACHASQHGKGGFKLSVFGFDPQADYDAMAKASRQRRVNFARPEESLLLKKPSTRVPHGGGFRLASSSTEYMTLKAWIACGAPPPKKDAPQVNKVVVSPSRRVGGAGLRQQLRVEAHYSDDSIRDVTALANFDSVDEGVLLVSRDGLVEAVGRGQAPIMVRFDGHAEIAMFVIPFAESAELAGWKSNNFVDELAAVKFSELGLEPSPICDDATFIRRAYLDAIGGLPSAEQTMAFIELDDPAKREKLVDQLLGLTGDAALDIYNDQFAAFWTLKWSDLIRNNSNDLGEQGMWALHNWIRESFRTNKPFDQFVRELVTAKGSIYSSGPANYFRIHRDSSALTEATAQLFMGVRLECAKCHHHPFEKFSQTDYYGLAAFFSRVGTKSSEEFGLFGRETIVMVRNTGEVNHPRTKKRMEPTPLGGEPLDDPLDRRIPLAGWLTSAKNEYFARSVVNRYFGYLVGRGLVDPIDDLRSTNPPSNVALMDALAKDFTKSGFDLKHLIRTIMTSRLYQLSSQPTEANQADRRFYSHYRVKRLAAESLLDAVDTATGVQTKFKSLPLGTRAIELPDAEYPNYFLTVFAKPRRASVCECERSPDENLAQALHTLNGETLAKKIADKQGRVAKLIEAKLPHEEIVQQLFLSALCRLPSGDEMAASREFLEEAADPTECYEDLLWALINSKQFLFVR